MKNSKLVLAVRVACASRTFVEASGERQDETTSLLSSSLSFLSPVLTESAVAVAIVFIDLFKYCDTDELKSILFVTL